MRAHRPLDGRPLVALLLAVGLAVSGCETAKSAARVLRLPGATTETRVNEVAVRSHWIDARLGDLRLFFLDDKTCRAVLTEGNEVEWVESGPLGDVRSDEGSCEPVGIASLGWWRSRRGRRVSPTGAPASPIHCRQIYRDEDVVMLRGRFPLATRANFRGDDVIAVIDAGDACVADSLDSAQDGQMIFRTSGPVPFALRLQGSQCTIQGFVNPFDLH